MKLFLKISVVFFLQAFIINKSLLNAQSFYGSDSLKDKAFSFKAAMRLDGFNNFNGGLDKGGGYLGEADLQMKFSTEKAGLWKGGELFVQGMNVHGKKPSANVVGDYQTFSNIESDDHTSFYEFWYNQHFFGDRISVLFGQLDLNADFSVTDNGSNFINSSFGVIPTLSVNNRISIFPMLTVGGIFKLKITKHFKFLTGFYNGNIEDFNSNPYAINWEYKNDQGFYKVSELHYYHMKDTNITGTYKLGLFYSSATCTNFINSDTLHENYGLYFIADQLLLPGTKSPDQGLNAFFEASIFPDDRNVINLFLGGGIRYHGLFTKRKDDDFGIAVANAWMSRKFIETNPDTILKHETAIELTYKAQINANIIIQPEIQYIINPGARKEISSAMVGLIRVIIKFEN